MPTLIRAPYSQNGEEEALLKVFLDHDPGQFLDIGAYDGKTFSNTLALAEVGWSGVLVEPSPEAFIGLKAIHGDNPRMKLVHAAVGCEPLLVELWNSPDAVSTTHGPNYEHWKAAAHFDSKFWIPQLTIEQILNQFAGPFDFVNIDTEGTSVDIFLRMPLKAMFPKAVCIEHDNRQVEIMQMAAPLGYAATYMDGNNVILVR